MNATPNKGKSVGLTHTKKIDRLLYVRQTFQFCNRLKLKTHQKRFNSLKVK